ncbi:helix-turn-helix transcriptional regulator [Acidovorax sp. HDW3]|uniref:XRE family transcriptional regulator n=1 Tax=Acidovorax sp. HDW3 TaxID=2714923 RepID=UPI00140DBA00|nr:S24 family peptidase [Acidovorax sp. HDW3]QIL44631.1 helix-turn-helix transcriptional regulator [Acidovorax sp. HDW3]
MADIHDRLKEERKRLGLNQTELGQAGGVGKEAQLRYESGARNPDTAYLEAIASAGVDVPYLFTGRRSAVSLTGPAPAPADAEDAIHIPLLSAAGSMGCGNELLSEDVILGHVPMSRRWLQLNVPRSRPEALQLVHAYGDSMAGTLNSGDFAIVDTDATVADIDGVYVLQAGGQLFIKRVTRKMNGTHEVSSDNPHVNTVDVLDGSQQVRICGRVVWGWNGRRL